MSEVVDKIPMKMVRDFVNQPINGLLYDLNMLPEVLSVHGKKNSKEWLLMKVIMALKEEPESVKKPENPVTTASWKDVRQEVKRWCDG